MSTNETYLEIWKITFESYIKKGVLPMDAEKMANDIVNRLRVTWGN